MVSQLPAQLRHLSQTSRPPESIDTAAFGAPTNSSIINGLNVTVVNSAWEYITAVSGGAEHVELRSHVVLAALETLFSGPDADTRVQESVLNITAQLKSLRVRLERLASYNGTTCCTVLHHHESLSEHLTDSLVVYRETVKESSHHLRNYSFQPRRACWS